MPEMKLCFVLGDVNENGKPDLHVRLSIGSLEFPLSPPLDGPGLMEVLNFFKGLAGLD